MVGFDKVINNRNSDKLGEFILNLKRKPKFDLLFYVWILSLTIFLALIVIGGPAIVRVLRSSSFFLFRGQPISEPQQNINQQPIAIGPDFLLLGLYNVPITGFDDVKDRGFNTVHLYHDTQSVDEAEFYLKEADKRGLKVLQNMPRDFLLSGDDFWINWVTTLSKYDSLLYWYLPEEPTLHGHNHDSFVRLYNIIRQYDPQHRPIALYFGVEDSFDEWCDVEDIIFVGCYPEYSNEPRACVKRYIDAAREVCPGKDLIGVPAFFDSVDFNVPGGAPSPDQARFDAYTSIIDGTWGLMWFAYQEGLHLTSLWDGITNISYELESLKPVILSPDATKTIQLKIVNGPIFSPQTQSGYIYDSVQFIQKKYCNSTYLISSNLADGTLLAEFTNVPSNINKIEVLFENRSITVDNGTFQDSFLESAVHVYKFSDNNKDSNINGVDCTQ